MQWTWCTNGAVLLGPTAQLLPARQLLGFTASKFTRHHAWLRGTLILSAPCRAGKQQLVATGSFRAQQCGPQSVHEHRVDGRADSAGHGPGWLVGPASLGVPGSAPVQGQTERRRRDLFSPTV